MPKIKSIKNKPIIKDKIKKIKSTEVEKPKLKKKIIKNFIDSGIYWEASKVILRLRCDDNAVKDYVREFIGGVTICINKDKIGKKTKYEDNKWGIITDIIEDEKELVFVIEPTTE